MSSINRSAVQRKVTIVGNKRVGAYHQILLNVGDLVKSCKPGNFIAIAVGGESSKMVLRRAFAISRVSDNSQYGGTMELIVAPHGSGSRWLCAQIEGTELDIVAPLGTAFGIPTEPINALLIGGGYGSAPLFGLADVLKTRGCKVDMLLGASVGRARQVALLSPFSILCNSAGSMLFIHADRWRCWLRSLRSLRIQKLSINAQ